MKIEIFSSKFFLIKFFRSKTSILFQQKNKKNEI